MREKQVPPIIAAECFQTHQRFVSGLTPKPWFLEGIHPAARHRVATTQKNRAGTRSARPLAEPKAGATVNPMPTGRFLSRFTQGLALAPIIAFSDVLGIQLNEIGRAS